MMIMMIHYKIRRYANFFSKRIILIIRTEQLCSIMLMCGCVSELVSCPTLRVPAKASLDCTPAIGRGIGASSDLQVCRLSCSAGSEFITLPAGTPGTGGNITTWCGTQTGYRWLHEMQNITLPSCSGSTSQLTVFDSVPQKYKFKPGFHYPS